MTGRKCSANRSAIKIVAIAVGPVLGILALAGCTGSPAASVFPSAKLTASPTADAEAPTPEATTAIEPSASATSPAPVPIGLDARQAAYEADITDWPEPLPPGYVWPVWDELPHLDRLGHTPLGKSDNAPGIYQCILIDAAWHAYFETNDPVTSKDYATRADTYVVLDEPAIRRVTEDGRIVDEELAAANGACRAIVGDLHQ